MRVAELKSGSVDTKFYENSGKAALPADSLYPPIKEDMEALINGTSKEVASRRMYAVIQEKQVVA
jgi:hypothetical protein